MNLADNRASLVAVTARLRISEPRLWADRPVVDRQGRLVALPGSGGVAVGLHAGAPVRKYIADHAMPGITLEDMAPASGSHGLICLGNYVRSHTGASLGVVAGKRGGLAPGFLEGQFIGVEANDDVLREMAPGVEVAVETYGRGLALTAHPEIAIANCSPAALDALHIEESSTGVTVGIRADFPSTWAGPGLGSDVWIGDLEIAMPIERLPEDLSFGDIVAFTNIDARVTRFYRQGYLAVGVVSHGPSAVAGHGVGVTIVLSGPATALRIVRDDAASLASFLRNPTPDMRRYTW